MMHEVLGDQYLTTTTVYHKHIYMFGLRVLWKLHKNEVAHLCLVQIYVLATRRNLSLDKITAPSWSTTNLDSFLVIF